MKFGYNWPKQFLEEKKIVDRRTADHWYTVKSGNILETLIFASLFLCKF